MHQEYGGYMELDRYDGKEYHHHALALNCGHNALRYILQARKIGKLYLPYYLCASIRNTCMETQVEVGYYHLDQQFKPVFSDRLAEREYIYVVNYYGQLSNAYLSSLKERYGNLIIDNAQAFFQMPVAGADTLYTCRKFFGVPDGAYLYTDICLNSPLELEEDISYDRMRHVFGRYERPAELFYQDYVEYEKLLACTELKKMSRLTHNLLRAINYEQIKLIRKNNMDILSRFFATINKLSIQSVEGGFMYPLYLEEGSKIRERLIKRKIYVPVLWPDALELCQEGLERDFINNMISLPVDQRYGAEDMKFIADVVFSSI